MRPLLFHYKINGYRGRCLAVSVSQAIDRAKVDYLKMFEGVSIGSPLFRLKKSKISAVDLILDPRHLNRHVELYRDFKDGCCTQADIEELECLRSIINDTRMK